jgi:hypothetical protein
MAAGLFFAFVKLVCPDGFSIVCYWLLQVGLAEALHHLASGALLFVLPRVNIFVEDASGFSVALPYALSCFRNLLQLSLVPLQNLFLLLLVLLLSQLRRFSSQV